MLRYERFQSVETFQSKSLRLEQGGRAAPAGVDGAGASGVAPGADVKSRCSC